MKKNEVPIEVTKFPSFKLFPKDPTSEYEHIDYDEAETDKDSFINWVKKNSKQNSDDKRKAIKYDPIKITDL